MLELGWALPGRQTLAHPLPERRSSRRYGHLKMEFYDKLEALHGQVHVPHQLGSGHCDPPSDVE